MRVTADEINKAKQIPLIDFVDANGLDVIKQGKSYRLKDHDSLVITGNKFYWNSRSEGGYGSISFAMKYYDLKFPEAVKRVNEHEYGQLTRPQQVEKNSNFHYPKHYETNNTNAMRNYLCGERKIDSRVFDWCVNKDLLVQDMKKNAVFKWKDRQGNVVGADRQGTVKIDTKRGTYKNIVPSSQPDGGFTINVGSNPDKVAIFESPIDMLSYWSIKKGDVQNTKMVSMSGLKMHTLAKAMKDMKEEGHNIKQIISCVDNDDAGNDFHRKLERLFKKDVLIDNRPRDHKDWNDALRNTSAKQKKQAQQQAQSM